MTFNNKAYAVLKFIALVLLPASATLYFALAGIWDFPNAQQVVGTITAIDTFLGILLGLSTRSYNNSEERFDGTFVLEPDPEHGVSNLKLQSVDYAALENKDEITFRLKR